MRGHLPHPVTPATTTALADAFYAKKGKHRGSYNCGRCGLPKKGHVCHLPNVTVSDSSPADSSTCSGTGTLTVSPLCTLPPVMRLTGSNLRRALSFDDIDEFKLPDSDAEGDDDVASDVFCDVEEVEIGFGEFKLPVSCLWEVLRRLPPPSLLSAAKVCRGWRDCSKRLWKAAEELRLRVPVKTQVGFVGSVLQKCPALVRLSLTMESDMDSTMLACIAFACPNLECLEISTCEGSFNRITGDELGRFVADKRCLTSLKMEGCTNLGGFVLCSTTLNTLWLSDLHSLSKMVFNLPNLNEISLDFSRQENDSTDLTSMMDGLGRSCPRLQNIHIASLQLSHSVVLSLTAANLSDGKLDVVVPSFVHYLDGKLDVVVPYL